MTPFMEAKKQFNLEDFSRNSEAYYNKIKETLEQNSTGKFVALDFESENYWVGDTASDALKAAKVAYPEKLVYLIQVGYPSTFTIQSNIPIKALHKSRYDINRAYR